MSLLLERSATAPTDYAPTQTIVPPRAASGQVRVEPWGCVFVASVTRRRVMVPTTYDCVRFVIVRDGSVILTDKEHCSATVGDVVLVAPNTRFGYEPEGIVTVTTVAVDTDYLIEQLFWQHVDVFADRLTAYDYAVRLYPDPLQVLRIGEAALQRLGSLLDDLEALTDPDQGSPARFFRVQTLLFAVLDLLAPHITAARVPPVEVRRDGRCRDRAVSRWALLRPIRPEIRGAAELMRADLARQWRVADLAAHACLSSSQFERVFKEQYGLSPMAYLTMLRVQEMAHLLRTTDLLVEQICVRVGWHNRPHTARHFRRYYGVPPTVYRRQGPRTASLGGPGAAVNQMRDEQAGQW